MATLSCANIGSSLSQGVSALPQDRCPVEPPKSTVVTPKLLAHQLEACAGVLPVGRCLQAFQQLEAYSTGFYKSVATARWQESLRANPEWEAEQKVYRQETDPNEKLNHLSQLLRLAYNATDLKSHGGLLQTMYSLDRYVAPGFPGTLPGSVMRQTETQLAQEHDTARVWIEEQLLQAMAGGRAMSSVGLNTDALGRVADEFVELGAPRLARHYFDLAAEHARTEPMGRHVGNTALSYWYELRAFETCSGTERQERREVLDRIRASLSSLKSQAQNAAPQFDAPIVAHMPEALRGADAATIANYPTMLVPAEATSRGIQPVGTPHYLNTSMMPLSELGNRAVDEVVDAADWDSLREVVTAPWEENIAKQVPLFDRDPIIIYTPMNSDLVGTTAFPGTTEQLRNVEEVAWQLAYEAGDAHLLEAELFERINSLSGAHSSRDEVFSMTRNLQLVASRWVGRGGPMETLLLEDGAEKAAERLNAELWPLSKILQTKVHATPAAGQADPTVNALAQLLWTLSWDANLVLGQPQAAVAQVADRVVPLYENYPAVKNHIDRLRVEASWLFNGEARLDPALDVSGFPEGERAALYAGSRYWSSNSDVEAIGVPLLGSIGGGGLGALGASVLCGPAIPYCAGALMIVGGGLGAGGSMLTAREIHLAAHGTELAQSAKVGLAVVQQPEWEVRSGAWKFGLYVNMAMMAPVGPAGGGLGAAAKALVTGEGRNAAIGGVVEAALERSVARSVAEVIPQVGRGLKVFGKSVLNGVQKSGSMTRLGIAVAGLGADMLTDENYDLNPDGEVNNILGWGGAALIWNEAIGTHVLGVNASGQVVSLMMNTAGEIGLQALQDRPIKRPDGHRCFVANAFSTLATGLVRKPVMLGTRHINEFAFGHEVLMPIGNQFPRLTHAFRSVSQREGAVKAWLSPKIEISELQHRQLMRGVAGVPVEDFMGAYPGRFSDKWILPSADTHFRFQLREGLTREEFRQLHVSPDLKHNWVKAVAADGTLRYELVKGDAAVNSVLGYHRLGSYYKWNKGPEGLVGKIQMRDAANVEQLPPVLGAAVGAGEWQVVNTPTGKQYVWENPRIDPQLFPQIEAQLKTAKVGKWSPQLTAKGMSLSLVPYLGGVLALNSLAGSRAQNADRYNYPTNRVIDYGFGALVTEPFVKTPLGIDTVKAQFWGYTIALGTRVLLNYPFPTYSEPWIGQDKHFDRLDHADSDGAFAVVARNMHSFTTFASPLLDPVIGNNGPVSGTMWRLEYRALQTLRGRYDALFKSVVSHGVMNGGVRFDPKAAERLNGLAKMLDFKIEQMNQGGMALDEQRLVVVLATYVKSSLQRVKNEGAVYEFPGFKSLVDMMSHQNALFAKLPTLSSNNDVWAQWIKGVNQGQFDHLTTH